MQRLRFRREHRHAPTDATLHPLTAEQARGQGCCRGCYERLAEWSLLVSVGFGGLGDGDPFASISTHTPLCDACAARFRAVASEVVLPATQGATAARDGNWSASDGTTQVPSRGAE